MKALLDQEPVEQQESQYIVEGSSNHYSLGTKDSRISQPCHENINGSAGKYGLITRAAGVKQKEAILKSAYHIIQWK